MNPSLDKALYYLTGNGNLNEVPIESLKNLVENYPYFPIGHLLLAKKLKKNGDDLFTAQLQKTALYIGNPYWLHYQLLNYPPAEIEMMQEIKPAQSIANDVDQSITPEHHQHEQKDILFPAELIEEEETSNDPTIDTNVVPITTEFTKEEIVDASELAHEHLGETNEDELVPDPKDVPITTEFTHEEIESASELAHEHLAEPVEIVPDPHEVPITTEFTQEEIETASELAHVQLAEINADDATEIEHENGEAHDESDGEVANDNNHKVNPEEVVFTNAPTDSNRFAITEVKPEIEPETTIATAEAQELSTNNKKEYIDEFQPTINNNEVNEDEPKVTQAEEEMAAISREPNETTEAFIQQLPSKDQQTESEPTVDEEAEPDEHEVMFQNIKAMLDATTEESEKGVEGGIVPIDPYHTIDYFASQGIKVELDVNPQDKLGKQVKKFTQWLRHMKKLGPEDAIEQLQDEETETEIQQIADTSNTAREVVTEAMAQVLEKQGKTDKAIQLYTKLSFLNPHKSTYFADKIKTLKDS